MYSLQHLKLEENSGLAKEVESLGGPFWNEETPACNPGQSYLVN